MDQAVADKLLLWAERYNNPKYFEEDPIAFPRRFHSMMTTIQPVLGFEGGEWRPCLQDVEIAAVFAAHFAWGRRAMIVRDCSRLFDEMMWRPYDYVMAGDWRSDSSSIHRTVKWSEVARICKRLKEFYSSSDTLESLSADEMRTKIYGQKADPKAANKKIWMLRRWMIRNDGRVDLGLWKNSSPADLVIPLDVHVYRQATELGLTKRRSKDIVTARDITESFRELFPGDPAKGDFALFGYGVNSNA
ncbi:MAG: TIGR02757 family protein [Bacteroidales bacterium]|nr:TIGR02757 family protein [Bacteroidales bacterium]